jgi:hypothetical protein
VPYGPGLISITGPSVSDPGCANVYFLDPDGIPLLIQAWDHHDMVVALDWYSLDFWNPEMELQFDLTRAMASQTVMVLIDGAPAPDMTPVRAFDPTQTGLPPFPENYGEIFWSEEGRLALAATGLPFGAGVTDLRYPEWLSELPDDILILVHYEAPNPGPVTIGQTILGGSFFDRGDGFLVGPTLYFCDCDIYPVTIDIKPGGEPNPINLKSKGKVPVAVLTTEIFDASDVDPDTVEFAGAVPLRWVLEDVDEDGDMDLLFHFKTQELALEAAETEAVLSGETFGGMAIEASDSVKVISE